MVSCSEADTKKNCCFRRSSLPYLRGMGVGTNQQTTFEWHGSEAT